MMIEAKGYNKQLVGEEKVGIHLRLKRICQCSQEARKESCKIFVDLIATAWYGQKGTNLSHAPSILCIKTFFLGLES